jgi:hypothetical protein
VNTPENITALAEGEVFVFGSHVTGHHAGGAARFAVERFGAIVGQGEGLQGDSYAIPTMGTLEEIRAAVGRFLNFAHGNPGLRFLVTKIGTGIAGYSEEVVAPLFRDHPANVVLPISFAILAGDLDLATRTVSASDFEMVWDEDHTFPFFEDENADAIYGYGHIDDALFAQQVNEYDTICNGGPVDFETTASDVVHKFAVAFRVGERDDDWRFTWAGVTEATPGAFPLTMVSR